MHSPKVQEGMGRKQPPEAETDKSMAEAGKKTGFYLG
jgi:hypothetical protein